MTPSFAFILFLAKNGQRGNLKTRENKLTLVSKKAEMQQLMYIHDVQMSEHSGQSTSPGPGLSFMSVQHTQYAIVFNSARQFQRFRWLILHHVFRIAWAISGYCRAVSFIRVKF